MALVKLQMQAPGAPFDWKPSDALTWIDDTTLVAYTGTPATSDTLWVNGGSRVVLYINATPEAAQSIRFHILSGPTEADCVYRSNNGVWTGIGTQTYTFSDTTNKTYELLLENVAPYSILRYGYVGGTGAGASLVVKVQAKRMV